MSLIDLLNKKSILPLESEALIGREEEIEVPEEHFVKGTPLKGPFPDNLKQAIFGMGCFWGVERRFWELEGVYSTSGEVIFQTVKMGRRNYVPGYNFKHLN